MPAPRRGSLKHCACKRRRTYSIEVGYTVADRKGASGKWIAPTIFFAKRTNGS